MAEGSMTKDEATSALLAYMFSGALGSPKDKGVAYALISESPSTFVWSAALEAMDGPPMPIDRYKVKINRQSREISSVEPITISESELEEAVFAATGHHLASASRFTDGALSISYKVTVQESPDTTYIVQLRHHGSVASMDALMTLVTKTLGSDTLPVPLAHPIPGEKERQEATGMGRQITSFIPGVVASSVYPRLPHEEKLDFVRKMALSFQACWAIPLPEPRMIGELSATTDVETGEVSLSIGPDRHHSLGGPFSSVREYLRAYIRSSLVALEKQQGIQEYHDRYLHRIRVFVDNHLDKIPAIVEDIPIVAVHADMGPHNVIVSAQSRTEMRAIIDWEFIASAPYASLHRIIEMLFRKSAPNGFGPEYERADELRAAFWGAIPEWKEKNDSQATQVFLEWFRFALFMKPEWRPEGLPEDEAVAYWKENVRVVESMLDKYP